MPINTVNSKGMIRCFKIDKVMVDSKELKEKFLISTMEERIKIDGVDCILPEI